MGWVFNIFSSNYTFYSLLICFYIFKIETLEVLQILLANEYAIFSVEWRYNKIKILIFEVWKTL